MQPGLWGLLAGLAMVPQLMCFTGVAVLQARGQTRQGQTRGQDRQGHKQDEHLWYSARKQWDVSS